MKKIIKYVAVDILRNRIILAYTAFLLVISFSIFNLEDSSAKGLLSMLNIVLLIVPLTSIVFSTIYIYNSSEFVELLVSQPLRRRTIWTSLFLGLSGALSIAYLFGAGIAIVLYEPSAAGCMMIVIGIFLSIIFSAIAMLVGVIARDKAKGIGASILLWLYFTLLFDGLVLYLLFQFADYPLEKPMMAISMLNPIDLSRILLLLKMDISAMMGYTGAIFKDFFGTTVGILISFLVLLTWIISPFWLSLQRFNNKDL